MQSSDIRGMNSLSLKGETLRLELRRSQCPWIRCAQPLATFRYQLLNVTKGFWFTNITIGAAELSVLVDTGSSNVAVNPNTLTLSQDYVGLNRSFTFSYGTTESNGGGVEFVLSPENPPYLDTGH